jgi:hypothetical protein
MTERDLAEVVEEVAGWPLQERRAYLANLEMFSAEDASQIKEALQALWTERK